MNESGSPSLAGEGEDTKIVGPGDAVEKILDVVAQVGDGLGGGVAAAEGSGDAF